jgi:hypothetical protein
MSSSILLNNNHSLTAKSSSILLNNIKKLYVNFHFDSNSNIHTNVFVFTEGTVIDMSAEERLTSCQKILQVIANSGFPCHIRSLEEVYSDYDVV